MSEKPLRSAKLLKNTFWATAGYALCAVIGFVSRSIFVNQLGDTITGVATLFTSILNLLNITELGFGTAVTVHLYKPVAEKDEKKIAALIALYRKAFCVFAAASLIIGSVLMLFIDSFVQSDYSIHELRLYFLLYLLKSLAACCFAAKGVLISVHQESYHISNITNAVQIVITLAQTIILYYTADFILYLVFAIVGVLVTNLLISLKADRLYPYLRRYRREKISKEEKKSIFDFIKATAVDRVAISIKSASDNIIVSRFVNVITTGIIGDYFIPLNTVTMVLGFFYNSAVPAIGNLAVTSDKESQYNTFKDFEYFTFWLYGFVSTGVLCTVTPLIRDVWIRDPMRILPFSTVLLIVLNFFIRGTRTPASIFFDVYGLIRRMPLINLFDMLANLVLSLLLVQWFGADGVYIGTVVSFALTNLVLTHFYVLKYPFAGKLRDYCIMYGKYLLITLVSGAAGVLVCNSVVSGGIYGLLLRVLLCTVSFHAVFIPLTCRCREFKSVVNLAKNLLPGKR